MSRGRIILLLERMLLFHGMKRVGYAGLLRAGFGHLLEDFLAERLTTLFEVQRHTWHRVKYRYWD